ncbi:MAG: DUF58 domain-containing protein [Limisphaerales bacterium]|jgi:uncharacterized protein (DUF58 family)
MDKKLIYDLLDPEVITKAEKLGLCARFIVEGYMAGEHKSPYRGFAIEFAQHREYSPGDDLRHLDWKVLGRTNRYYVKQYEQETNFIAHILLDGSESMKYGSGRYTKFDYGKILSACLAYLILSQRDAVAFAIFDSEIKNYVLRSDNRSSLINILNQLVNYNPDGKTSITTVLHNLAAQIHKKGIIILISDLFEDESKILEGIQHLRFCGHEVIVFHTLDPYELEFPFRGLVEFEGLEKIPKILTRPNEIRNSYMAELNAYIKRIREGCERNQSHYILTNTGMSLHEALSGYLAFRAKTTTRISR